MQMKLLSLDLMVKENTAWERACQTQTIERLKKIQRALDQSVPDCGFRFLERQREIEREAGTYA